MQFHFKTQAEFFNFFKDEKSCYVYLEDEAWKNGYYCPHCGSAKTPYKVTPRGKDKTIPSYKCTESGCNLPFTIKTNTIFEGTQIPLTKWFHAIYEIGLNKKGIASTTLSEKIGVSQKTAWLMMHKIREVLTEENNEKLDGVNQIDETFVGGKNKNRHHDKKVEKSQGRSFKDKTPVLGIVNHGYYEMVERQNKVFKDKTVLERVYSKFDSVRLFVVKDTSANSIHPILFNNIEHNSVLFTDEWMGYNGLDNYYHRYYVDHGKGQYVNGAVTTNKCENFWSIFKRGLIGVYQSVKRKHLQRYCNEFQLRFNTKHSKCFERFYNILSMVMTEKITYLGLTKLSI